MSDIALDNTGTLHNEKRLKRQLDRSMLRPILESQKQEDEAGKGEGGRSVEHNLLMRS